MSKVKYQLERFAVVNSSGVTLEVQAAGVGVWWCGCGCGCVEEVDDGMGGRDGWDGHGEWEWQWQWQWAYAVVCILQGSHTASTAQYSTKFSLRY